MIVCVYRINEKCVRLSRVMMHFQFQYNFRTASPPSKATDLVNTHTYTCVIIRLHNVMLLMCTCGVPFRNYSNSHSPTFGVNLSECD